MRDVTPTSYGAMAKLPSQLSSHMSTPADHSSTSYPLLAYSLPNLLLFEADLL
jgi:hypothetical protein